MQNKQKIVLITGVTKGLGRALVTEFIKSDWRVAGCGLLSDEIKTLQIEYGNNHIFAVVDIKDFDSVKNWAKEVLSKLGTPDLLINNAGIINKKANLWQISESEFKNVMETNVLGTFNIIKAFVPEMIKEKMGKIINISSSWGREAESMFAPYSASKFAIEGLTKSLAKELPKGLIAVSLDPGEGIITDMLKQCCPDETENYPTTQDWAKKAVPFILKIDSKDNGKALTIS